MARTTFGSGARPDFSQRLSSGQRQLDCERATPADIAAARHCLEDVFPTDLPSGMPSDMPSDMPTEMPSDFDPENLPEGVDPENLPEGFPSGGADGQGSGFGALQDPEVQDALDA